MREYRITTFLTLYGRYEFIDVGDGSYYAEWIIDEDNVPRFSVNPYTGDSESDKYITKLIEDAKLDMETIIQRINKVHNRRLKISPGRPWIEIVLKSEMRELDLKPLPIEWLSF